MRTRLVVAVLVGVLAGGITPGGPALAASASGARPDVPTELANDSATVCASGPERPSVSHPPQLYAKGVDPDAGNLALTFEWRRVGGPVLGSGTTSFMMSDSVFVAQVPPGVFADGDDISWRVRATDGSLTSAFSAPCELHLDTMRPGAPSLSVTTTPTVQGDPGAVQFGPAGADGVVAYRWSVDGSTQPDCVPAAADQGCEATFATTSTFATLEVQGVDPAGNLSDRVSTQLSLRPSSLRVADWQLPSSYARWTSFIDVSDELFAHESGAASRVIGGRPVADGNAGPRSKVTSTGRRAFAFDGVNDYLSSRVAGLDTTPGVTLTATVQTSFARAGVPQTVAAVAGRHVDLLELRLTADGGLEAVARAADSPDAGVVTVHASRQQVAAWLGGYSPRGSHRIMAALDQRHHELRLSIQGRPESLASAPLTFSSWSARGPVVVGSGTSEGVPGVDPMGGVVYDVSVDEGGSYPRA